MKDRYEIRAKIGQGGIGAVYRAFDRRLNREVAIKRVLPEGNFENEGEAIAHLLKEATALSSVQHPHIVTVYDAGVDEDGPYVVMELLAGRTLDQMIEQGTLVWSDFREVAIQSQEALIAAQDLNLVHRDLKPTNVMVVWLASGKFQIKIVDFGLAKFSPKPSLQTIDHGDAVFGSIHFMAPEQFERNPLDQRTDMYAMGCLYYYCLTGLHPFTGDSAPEVMKAHLQHFVTPLQALRPDLPAWVCDWVMWQISRNMSDRPSNARESLQKFLMNEEQHPSPAEGEDQPKAARPKFVFPGAATNPPQPAPLPITGSLPPQPAINPPTTPQPLQAPVVQPPAAPALAVPPPPPVVPVAAPVVAAPPAPMAVPVAPTPPAPLVPIAAVAPPQTAILTPAIHQAAAPQAAVPVAQAAAPAPQIRFATPAAPAAGMIAPPAAVPLGAAGPARPAGPQGPSTIISGQTSGFKKKGMSNTAKSSIAAVLGLAVILAAWVVINKMGSNSRAKEFNALVVQAKDLTARDVPTTAKDVDLLLAGATSISANADRQAVYQRLLIAQSSDGTDIDLKIAEFAGNDANQMISDIRVRLFEVLQGRKSPSALPALIAHARSTNSEQTAAAAITACEKIATEKNLADLLNIMRYNRSEAVRQAAKRTISAVAKRTNGGAELSAALKTAYETASDDQLKLGYLELLGSAGGDEAGEIIKSALKEDDKKTQIAAVAALRSWPDDTMFETLIDFATGQKDDLLRAQTFDAAYAFLTLDRERDELDLEDMWKLLAREARTTKEKRQIIDGLAKLTDDWAFSVVEFFEEDEEDEVSARAEKAREFMESRRERIQGEDEE